MTYDWLAGIVVIALIAGITKVGKWVAFKNADLERMRLLNIEMDAPKRKRTRYPPVMKGSRDVGTIMNAVFFIGLVPFFVTLNSVPIWRGVVDTLAILFVFDFFYYLTHRFIFHGPLMFKAHAVHHEAHNPSHIDAFYVHPLETTVGLFLFMGSALGLGLVFGPFHVASMGIATVIFVQVNTINHTYVDLPHSPFKILDYITTKHSIHHKSMKMGNYATLTMVYDYMFGTLD
jgi:sterol desaturase/sphingolipid hydroxylase (fatty acid hydroxylase superfamily)